MVLVLPAVEGVVATTAAERVISEPGGDHVVTIIPDDQISPGGADNPLNPGEGVALGVTAGAKTSGQVDGHPSGRAMVPSGVPSIAAIQTVGAKAAKKPIVAVESAQGVVAGAATQGIVPVGAGQMVVVDGALQILNRQQGVTGSVAAFGGAGLQIDGHGGRRFPVKGVIAFAGAAVEKVGAGPTLNRIGAVAAGQVVVAVIARQHIVAGAAADVVTADARHHRIVTKIADDDVIAGQSPQRVGRRIVANQGVVVILAITQIADLFAGGIARTIEILDRLFVVFADIVGNRVPVGRVLDIVGHDGVAGMVLVGRQYRRAAIVPVVMGMLQAEGVAQLVDINPKTKAPDVAMDNVGVVFIDINVAGVRVAQAVFRVAARRRIMGIAQQRTGLVIAAKTNLTAIAIVFDLDEGEVGGRRPLRQRRPRQGLHMFGERHKPMFVAGIAIIRRPRHETIGDRRAFARHGVPS